MYGKPVSSQAPCLLPGAGFHPSDEVAIPSSDWGRNPCPIPSERTAAYQSGSPESGRAAITRNRSRSPLPCHLNERPFTAGRRPITDGPQSTTFTQCRPSALGTRPSSPTDPRRHQNETQLTNFVVLFGAPTGYHATIKFDGPILDNLTNALASARRLRGHPVYKDTLTYWNELIQEARRIQREPAYEQADLLEAAIVSLEVELAERGN